jgi:hypothetical protein
VSMRASTFMGAHLARSWQRMNLPQTGRAHKGAPTQQQLMRPAL